jgi:hypothetical protein
MRHRKLKKKAVIEVGFSWIFILIAGAVILGLFAYIGVNQGNFFKTMFHANLLTDLNSIFIGAMVSKDTAAIFQIPSATLNFDCTSYSIEGISHPIEGRLVFGPKNMKTSELITWSKPWSLGFRISNMLYITSPYVKYIVAYTSAEENFARQVYNDLPSQLTKELLLLDGNAEIKLDNYERTVVMVLGQNENYNFPSTIYDPDKFSHDEIAFLYVLAKTLLGDGSLSTTIMFKDKNQNVQSFSELGVRPKQSTYDISSVYGAFISGDALTWQCVMERAYFKARHVTEIYKLRTRNLNLNPLLITCNNYYNQAENVFQSMDSNLWYRHLNGAIEVKINELSSNINNFNIINDMLERASCPLIY